MIYDVRHKTTFTYEDIVSVSQHVLHLTPRPHPRQTCLEALLVVEPNSAVESRGSDYFGNPVRYLTVQEPHEQLIVDAHSKVEVRPAQEPLVLVASEPWDELRRRLGDDAALNAYEFSFESPYVIASDEVQDYARQSFDAGRPILDAAMDLTSRIFRDFEYRGGVSDVSTPVREVFAMRKGVCQDFAHLEIACLRSLGLAARYVSGYIVTHPPEGKDKLVGSDASHAWLSVWAGELGWVDFDPTNNVVPGLEHITIGWGRDYGDVSPINGFIVGGGTHQVSVAVSVSPLPAAG